VQYHLSFNYDILVILITLVAHNSTKIATINYFTTKLYSSLFSLNTKFVFCVNVFKVYDLLTFTRDICL